MPTSNSSLVTDSAISSQVENDRFKKRSPLEIRKSEGIGESISKLLPHSQKGPLSILNSSIIASTSNANTNFVPTIASTVITSQNSGGTVTISPAANPLKHSRDKTPISNLSGGGEPIKRKRGRPRILDADTDIYNPIYETEEQNQQGKY